ncbi:hypothetical protein BC937DRAFT_95236 [Endogone sp. FLAS-F59071]|nr:hypothetical protein BC937DRAFT_95236 [Endogone sp. FLAS-F59071]|eukprot:RUS20433.1 hypothetical protein BC937DRAFT_95236 [Endogone sp. FLAS-F59071]
MFAGDVEIEDIDDPRIWRRLHASNLSNHAVSLMGTETVVQWIYTNMFDREISCQQHTLLFPVPSWMDSNQQARVRHCLFDKLQIPYLAMIDASVLALQSHGLKTGILVSVGGQFTYVAAVVEVSLRLSVHPIDLVSLVDQCLQKAAVPEDTKVALRKHVVVSGGHAYAVAPIQRSRLGLNEYKVYGPSNPDTGQFDVVRGAENLFTMPQTKETIRALFTSIDEYAASTERS